MTPGDDSEEAAMAVDPVALLAKEHCEGIGANSGESCYDRKWEAGVWCWPCFAKTIIHPDGPESRRIEIIVRDVARMRADYASLRLLNADLLAACEAALKNIEAVPNGCDGVSIQDDWPNWPRGYMMAGDIEGDAETRYAQLRAAIKKANDVHE